MRVVGGRLRGRALAVPADDAVRPTSDRVREAMFNILAHGVEGFELNGARVLDLFAGTGALGIEALSRGAQHVTFVEHAAQARALIQDNIATLGLGGVTTIFRRSALDLGSAYRKSTFDLVFADPPYGQGLAERAIGAAIDADLVAAGAVVVIEEAARATVVLPPGCARIDQRLYGQTQVLLARFEATSDGAASAAAK